MKKKMIKGLFVGLFVGALGFGIVSEAGSPESHSMKTYKIGRHRKFSEDKRTSLELQKKWEETNDYSHDRRENARRNHIENSNQRHHSRMTNSCW